MLKFITFSGKCRNPKKKNYEVKETLPKSQFSLP